MKTETPTILDNIKENFEKVIDKDKFFECFANDFKLSKSSVRTGLFSRFEFTEKYRFQETANSYLQNYINNQNK